MSRQMEVDTPKVVAFDAFGGKSNSLYTCHEWRYMHAESAREGLISIGYKQRGSKLSTYHPFSPPPSFSVYFR